MMVPLADLRSAVFATATAIVLAPLAAGAQSVDGASAWVSNRQAEVRLVSAVTGTGGASRVQLGLEFRLQPGWKIYWRSPGDAGYPPRIDWAGSVNLADAIMSWPAPHRFSVSGLETMGYEDEVVLPIDARLADPGKPLGLRAALDYLTCSEICIPRHADLALSLGAGPADPSPRFHLIGRYLAQVPGDGSRVGMSLLGVAASGSELLEVTVAADPPLAHPDLFVERADGLSFGRPSLRREDGRAILTLKAEPGTGEGAIAGVPLTVTLVDGERAMEATLRPIEASGIDAAGLAAMIGIALLGGLILNLMPCVLPVLSLKLLYLVDHGGAERRRIRRNFLATAAGILVSFLVLAAAAIATRAAGMAVGWGIQFQQPLFLAAMVVTTTVFAANLFGFFEFALPASVAGAVAGRGDGRTLGAQFLQGVFATLLATPCSAPFLGTAIGFALARGSAEIVAIFAALGVGMGLPYLAIAVWPRLVAHLPHPGRWMLWLRAALGMALIGTAIWLLGVLAAEAGARAAWTIAALMAAALLVLALRERLAARLRLVAVVLLALGAGLAAGLGTLAPGTNGMAAAAGSGEAEPWRPFDRAGIAGEVAAGKVVFVDVTADWCVTCLVNKRAVIDRPDLARRLTGPKVVAMRADWTRPSDAIAAYLASFGRYGIPFNAVYGPGAPNGIALPELLTGDEVVRALDKAAAPAS